MAIEPVKKRAPRKPRNRAGPTDIADPVMRSEAKRAFVWLGMASLLALGVLLSESLLIIFGGMVFAALIDGGSRLLGRVLNIGRGWRVTIVLLLTVSFLVWVVLFAGSQIADQAAQLPATVQAQTLRLLAWLRAHGYAVNTTSLQGLLEKAIGGVSEVTQAVGGVIGAITTVILIIVLGIYLAVEPRLYQRGFAWMLPADQRDYFEGTAQLMGRALRRLLAGRLLGMSIEGMATWLMLQV